MSSAASNQTQSVLIEQIKQVYTKCTLILFGQYKINYASMSPDEIMQEFVKDGNAAIREYMLSSAAIAEKEKNEADSLRVLSFKMRTRLFDAQKDEIAKLVDNVRMYLLLNELPFDIPNDIFDEEDDDKLHFQHFQHLSENTKKQQLAEAQQQVEKALKQLAQAQRHLLEEVKRMQAA